MVAGDKRGFVFHLFWFALAGLAAIDISVTIEDIVGGIAVKQQIQITGKRREVYEGKSDLLQPYRKYSSGG